MQDLPAGPSRAELAAENRRLSGLLAAAGIDPAADRQAAGRDFAPLLLNAMSEGVYVVDRTGRTTMCNSAMLRLLGFERPEDVIGRSLHQIIHHSHADGTHYPVETCPIYRAAREGVSMVVDDEVFYRRDGTAFPVEYRTEPLYREGCLDGAICTFVDITDRIASEHALRESQERLALAIQAGGIGIWDYAPESQALTWDDRVRGLFGAAPGRAVTIDENLAAVHPGDRDTVDKALAAALDPTGSGVYHVQFRVIGIEDDKLRWVEAQGQATFRDHAPVRLLGTLRDISNEKEADLHLRLMVNELNHRVKNSLAMVQGVASQTFRHSENWQAARTAFMERLVALARAHDVLTATNWEGADLRQVVDESTRAAASQHPGRINAEGPRLLLSPKAALAFSIALHELTTNAIRFGALSTAAGTVTIRWRAQVPGEPRRLHFEWTESGGPPVHPPSRRGLGLKLIERGLAAELQGEIGIRFPSTGAICTIDAPLPTSEHRSMPE